MLKINYLGLFIVTRGFFSSKVARFSPQKSALFIVGLATNFLAVFSLRTILKF